MSKLVYEKESYVIRGGCFEVYKQFRNRHKEKVYARALIIYLQKHGLAKVGAYIPDIVVNDTIFLELKCKPFLSQDDQSQFWYYLKVTNFKLGFLINFGGKHGVEIIRRVHSK